MRRLLITWSDDLSRDCPALFEHLTAVAHEIERTFSTEESMVEVVLSEPKESAPAAKLDEVVRDAESRAIERAMRQNAGNIVRTSKALGIQRNTLKRKLRALGLYPEIAK